MKTTIASLVLTLLLTQDRYPAEDHAWLRFKSGASVTNKVVVEIDGVVSESLQILTMTEKKGDDYVIEETTVRDGLRRPGSTNRTSAGTYTGEEMLTIAGKEHPCRICTAKGKRDGADTETRYWMPRGNKYPLKVVFKQADGEGEVVAVAIDEKVKVGDHEYSCAKLSGKVKFGGSDGVLTAWVTQEIPGGQARLELTLKNPNGDVKVTITPKEIQGSK